MLVDAYRYALLSAARIRHHDFKALTATLASYIGGVLAAGPAGSADIVGAHGVAAVAEQDRSTISHVAPRCRHQTQQTFAA